MPEPRPGHGPGFERDVKAVVAAFTAGLNFQPPAISVKEFREELRYCGLTLSDSDDLELPRFNFPVPVEDDDETDFDDDMTEGDDDGNDPTA